MLEQVGNSAKALLEDIGADRYRAPALDKGLDILELLSQSQDGMTQAEMARAFGRPATEFYRMLERLVRRQYVVKNNSDRYTLSMKLYTLAHRNAPMRQLVTLATPIVRDLAVACQQSCHLVVYDRGDAVLLFQVESPGPWGLTIRLGTSGGLTNTGSGRVMLAFSTAEKRIEMLHEHQLFPGEALPYDLDDQLDAIRANGYEMIESPQMTGVHLISAPIIGPLGSAFAALTITHLGRTDVATSLSAESCVPTLREHARQISALLAIDEIY